MLEDASLYCKTLIACLAIGSEGGDAEEGRKLLLIRHSDLGRSMMMDSMYV